MPTIPEIRTAVRSGVTNNTQHARAIRHMARRLRSANELTSDIDDAITYLEGDPATMEQEQVRQAVSLVVTNLGSMPGPKKRDFRDALRVLVLAPTSPPWLVEFVERAKRRYLRDRQATDPIEAATTAALVTIASATATLEELQAAFAALAEWLEQQED